MSPDDPRHGTNAGYVANCRCDRCATASWRYHKALHIDHERGHYRTIDATGTRRRIEALGCLGWTGVQIGALAGLSGEHVRQLRLQARVNRSTHTRILEVFETLSMQRPPERTHMERLMASRQRGMARRLEWSPPLAWDDIDNPNEQPDLGGDDVGVDPVIIRRILNGDWRLRANQAERLAVIDVWEGSQDALEQRTGWNVARDLRTRKDDREEAA